VALAKATLDRWFSEDGVGMIVDVPNTTIALAAQKLAAERGRIAVIVSAGGTALTGKACTVTGFQWAFNTYAQAKVLTKVSVAFGLDSWFMVTADYEFGWSLEEEARRALQTQGGRIVGSLRVPRSTADFTPYLGKAMASDAKVLALANAGSDLVNAMRGLAALDVGRDRKEVVAMLVFQSDVEELGLQAAQGLTFPTAFYWDRDGPSRAWSKRFFDRRGSMPTMAHAGVYSAVAHYLKSLAITGRSDGAAVAATMRRLPVEDFFAGHGQVRADGLMVHDMLLVRVKEPAQQYYPWDDFEILTRIPGDKAFQPLAESECPLVKGAVP
jgi:branched-chain amino acid transport system substrate-binding protein